MTNDLPLVFTSPDFVLLEHLLDAGGEPFAGAAEIIRRKLAAATLVFPEDVPADVVTLNSRVRFAAGTALSQETTLVVGPGEVVHGPTLLLNSPRGLALIGAAAGQTVQARRPDGSVEHLFIEAVPYQPEQQRTRPALKVVSSQERPDAPVAALSAASRHVPPRLGGDDDPGPSAA